MTSSTEIEKAFLRAAACLRTTAWRKAHPEKAREASRLGMAKWRKENPEKVKMQRKAWKQANPDKVREQQRRERLGRFDLTPDAYARILLEQGGVCAICGKPPGRRSLAVDHDHETDAVRGLLCFACNTGLGKFEDNVQLLKSAIWYLDHVLDHFRP